MGGLVHCSCDARVVIPTNLDLGLGETIFEGCRKIVGYAEVRKS